MPTSKAVSVGFGKDLPQVNQEKEKPEVDISAGSGGSPIRCEKTYSTVAFSQFASSSSSSTSTTSSTTDNGPNSLSPIPSTSSSAISISGVTNSSSKSSIEISSAINLTPAAAETKSTEEVKEKDKKPQPRQYRNGRVFRNESQHFNALRRTSREFGPSDRFLKSQGIGNASSTWGQPLVHGPRYFGPRSDHQNSLRHLPSQSYDGAAEHKWHGEQIHEIAAGFYVTSSGLVSIHLHPDIRVDLTVDQAIRVINIPKGIVVSLNSSGTQAALIHPCGRMYQYGSRVEIATSDPRGNSKYAKMWHRGVSFTAEQCAVIYLVDSAGTRTVTDTFSDTDGDFSVPIFLSHAKFGFQTVSEWYRILQDMQYWISTEGYENWVINGIRISITGEGLVRVTRGPSKYNLRVGMTGAASITTPYVHATASISGSNSHLFAKRGERRMHYDGSNFIVRNGGHSSGMDNENKLKVY